MMRGVKKHIVIVCSALFLSPALHADEVRKKLERLQNEIEMRTEVMICGSPDSNAILKCLEVLSVGGNHAATASLAEIHADPSVFGMTQSFQDADKSVQFAVMAIAQGSGPALDFVPPKPFDRQIGMSSMQVGESTSGRPDEVLHSSREVVWVYPTEHLVFTPSEVDTSHLVLRRIEPRAPLPTQN